MSGNRSLPRPSLSALAQTPWDLVVIGGGITGAGVLLEAARRGQKVLLLEQQDFAWGTSSRSSKMVHGGLRYLAQGDIRLTQHSLQERERLLTELPHMVVRLPYLFPIQKGRFPGRLAMTAVLFLYDFLARHFDHRWLSRKELETSHPALLKAGIKGAMRYTDALTDDARLVLRVLHEARHEGGVACNYMRVASVTPEAGGFQVGVHDACTGMNTVIRAGAVVNATGAWADTLSSTTSKIRPQRGSHIFLPAPRIPVQDCLTVMHPDDGRPVFVYPWKGLTCIGTTDLDHGDSDRDEPYCTAQETAYLLKVANHVLPGLNLAESDITASIAGVRPIIASGKGLNPSKERRDHEVWRSPSGLVNVSGGKLTTFRLIALDVLKELGVIGAAEHKAGHQGRDGRCFTHQVDDPHELSHPLRPLAEGAALREQITWILRHEQVVHLDDLMLRRLRAGLQLKNGGQGILDEVGELCRRELGWDDARWADECARYRRIIDSSYSATARQ